MSKRSRVKRKTKKLACKMIRSFCIDSPDKYQMLIVPIRNQEQIIKKQEAWD